MIRLKDVAARAGVSLMTVSKVLRDAPDVSIATKSRIRRLADEMGYVPDASARELRTRLSRLFGLIVPTMAHPVCARVGAVIQERSHELGYDLLIAQTRDDPHREEMCIRRFLARRVDGLFIHPVYRLAPSARIYEELRQSRFPTVLLGPQAPFCGRLANVEADDTLASSQVTRHLITLGHRQIAFFAGPPAAPWAQARFEGYRQALRDAGIRLSDGLVFTAGDSAAHGERAALQLLGESAEATAVQAASDHVAMGAAWVFLRHGLRIPEDLSVAGFGNEVDSAHFPVSLTTVQLPDARLGSAASDAMLRLLAGEAPNLQSLPAQLIIRASTAAPTHPNKPASAPGL